MAVLLLALANVAKPQACGVSACNWRICCDKMQLIDAIAAEISAPRLTLIASTVPAPMKVPAASSSASTLLLLLH